MYCRALPSRPPTIVYNLKVENAGMYLDFFAKTYTNPVYPHSFPDPFVFKFRGEYYAFSTDFADDGKVFRVLRSRNLVDWTEIGGAMQRLDNDSPFYWAPEVIYHNGKFYLYYSVGNETLMEIRVAVSDRPDGDFVDSGHRMTNDEFAIDAHVFTDTDGERYLFYATDFLTHTHIGTGTVVDKMVDLFTLENNPRPVTRARYDWQVYHPNRPEKGGVRWHTVEGATVLKRKGIYYEMFSGGNWQNLTYGVSFAVSDDIGKDEEWTQFSDGEKVYPILRTVPDLIIGPGHNSVVRGVNNRELYCVYHRWTENGRVLAIDRMDFAGGARMFVFGATHAPQHAPFEPQVADFFDEFSNENWTKISGDWHVESNQIISGGGEKSELVCRTEANSFFCELSLRAVETASGNFGVALKNGEQPVLKFSLSPEEKCAFISLPENGAEKTEVFALAEDFNFRAFHLLRVETDYFSVKITLDETAVRFEEILENAGTQLSLFAENTNAAFSGFALTEGFEELFENADLEKKGWRRFAGNGDFRVENQHLIFSSVESESETIFGKEISTGDYELAINFRLHEAFADDGAFGFYPAFDESRETPCFAFENTNGVWNLTVRNHDESKNFALPDDFSPDVFRQLRFVKKSGVIFLLLETETLGMIEAVPLSASIALTVKNSAIALDMIRLTVL
jgi:GH43 family beta-xylosidase